MFGETYEEAARQIHSAIEGWVETARSKGTPIPSPIGNDALGAAAGLLNLTALSRAAGLPTQTLFSKLRRGTALKPAEGRAIASALSSVGLALIGKTA